MKEMISLGKLFEDFQLKFNNYSKRYVINTNKKETKEIKSIVKLQDFKMDNTLFKHHSQNHLNKADEN